MNFGVRTFKEGKEKICFLALLFGVQINSTITFSQCPDDHDCDGVINSLDVDDDNDGISDLDELTNCLDLSDLIQTQTLLYSEDFGSGAANPGLAIPNLIDPAYCFEDLTGSCSNNSPWVANEDIDDNEYSILNNPIVGFPEAFRTQSDHTPGDISGYQLVVNASDNPGIMFHKDNILISPGTLPTQVVVFSAWLSNIGSELNQQTCNDCCGGAIMPNVDFILEDASTGAPIGAPISSGDISPSPNGADAWVLYTAIFDVTGVSAVNIVIRNNQVGGCGNDVAIDDVSLGLLNVLCDFDQDGIPDYLDIDSDNDGIYDVVECGDGALDTNDDGVIDTNDIGFSDSNGNGASDASEASLPVDTDGDGAINSIDHDSDNDGCFDTVEAGHIDPDNDGILGTSPVQVSWHGKVLNQAGYTGTTTEVLTPGSFGGNSINYSNTVYMTSSSSEIPNVTGSLNGTFQAGSGLSLNNQTGEIFPASSSPGEYTIVYSTGIPCELDVSFTLVIEGEEEVSTPFVIEIPNVLSFSSNAGNENWFITYEGIQSYHCVILNRWGNIMFESINPADVWDGTTQNDKKVSGGVYFYMINGKTLNGEEFSKHGSITVLD